MIIRNLQQKQTHRVSAGDAHRMARRLNRYFAPRSLFPPPGAPRGINGNRNVALTAANNANAAPTDSDTVQLVPMTGGAVASWRFSTPFKNPPISIAIAMTPSLTGNPQEITVKGPGTSNSVLFQSTDPADTRLLRVHAIGNPD